ncbi:unnamed protein product [Lampetra planeri]
MVPWFARWNWHPEATAGSIPSPGVAVDAMVASRAGLHSLVASAGGGRGGVSTNPRDPPCLVCVARAVRESFDERQRTSESENLGGD